MQGTGPEPADNVGGNDSVSRTEHGYAIMIPLLKGREVKQPSTVTCQSESRAGSRTQTLKSPKYSTPCCVSDGPGDFLEEIILS